MAVNLKGVSVKMVHEITGLRKGGRELCCIANGQFLTCVSQLHLLSTRMCACAFSLVCRCEFTSENAAKNIPYQLQRLFLKLQTSKKKAIETTDITKSFGWDSSEGRGCVVCIHINCTSKAQFVSMCALQYVQCCVCHCSLCAPGCSLAAA